MRWRVGCHKVRKMSVVGNDATLETCLGGAGCLAKANFPPVASLLPTAAAAWKYVLHRHNHFCAFRIFEDGTCCVQTDCRCHTGLFMDLGAFDPSTYL